MKSLGDNGFIGRSSDGGDGTFRLVLMSCAAGLGAFAAGCGRNRAVQQSDTSAFGVKHIPYEMLFTANDNFIFCNLHRDSSSGKRARPSDTRCAACLWAPFYDWGAMVCRCFELHARADDELSLDWSLLAPEAGRVTSPCPVVTYDFVDKHCLRNYCITENRFID